MVKTLNIPLDENDYTRLAKAKGDLSWRDFVMTLAEVPPATDGTTK